MLAPGDLDAVILTVKLAVTATLILLVLGTPLAWWLAHTRHRRKIFIEALVALPLVLPPTVLGFYLLLALGPHGWIGQVVNAAGLAPLAFSYSGLVIGSLVYSLPFVIQPLANTFAAIGSRPVEAAATLGANRRDQWLSVIMPLARRGYLTAAVLGFAHTLGEFGVVLMIGGNIPQQTRVVSIAIYDHVEAMDYGSAHTLAALLLITSFIMLIGVYALNRRFDLVEA